MENNPTLSKEAANCIVDGRNMVFASAASVWEIGIKMALGKLEAPDNLLEEIRMHRFTPLPMTLEHAQLAGKLPDIHKDPFDRMPVAQAMIEKLTLATRDKLIVEYEIKSIKA